MISGPSPTIWFRYEARSPIRACALDGSDFARLFDIINEKQVDIKNEIYPLIVRQPNETEADFQTRQKKISDACLTTVVSITGANGKTVHGNARDIFQNPLLPERIMSVLFATATTLKTINITPPNQASLFLDFGRPPVLNFGVMPSAPTLNQSNYVIEGSSEAWVTSFDSRLRQFFEERSTLRGWIHQRGIYDVLVLLVGLPGSMWVSGRLGPFFYDGKTASILISIIYGYFFFASLSLFRLLFDYGRWLFPLIELRGHLRDRTTEQRALWWLCISTLALAAAYDVLKRAL